MKIPILLLAFALTGLHLNLANAQTTEQSIIYTTDSKEQKQKPGKNYPLRNTDPAWLGSSEAKRIADQVIAYQRNTGGWPKNIDMCRLHTQEELAKILEEKATTSDSTTDNGATTMQMTFLGRMYAATGDIRYREVFRKGMEYLLSGQYEDTGGWPQFWPDPQGYQVHITYNDDAMASTLEIMRQVINVNSAFGSDIVDEAMKARIKTSFDKGIECILATQILVDGQPTIWCQQHDRETLQPAGARTYELPSYCTQESARLVELLMTLPSPDTRVREAIDGAMSWFEDHKITGYRLQINGKRGDPDFDTFLVADEKAEPLWGRFYDLENGEVYVCDRDGVPKRSLQEIGPERRNGYSWYNTRPAEILPAYKEWKMKWGEAK